METLGVDAAMHDLVDRPLVAVKSEDDGFVSGEELHETRLIHAMGVILAGKQRHQVHDVDDPHAQFGRVLAQPPGSGDGFQRRRIAR